MNPSPASTDTIDAAAATWLARRDRGLTPAEQDDYMQWLAADPRHAEAVTRHAAALERMMQLYDWTPAHDTEPNPDLFAPAARNAPIRHRWGRWPVGLVAAAAVLTVILFLGGRPWHAEPVVSSAPKSYLRVNDRLALPDGSRVELKDGSRVVVQYSDTERRVQLIGGEAHFSVWKDKARPFVVDAGGVEVRAVGTAFNVRLGEEAVEVLVTEGKVQVEPVDAGGEPVAAVASLVTVGERAIVARSPAAEAPPAPEIVQVTHEDIARELAWQAPRLQFEETRLADAIAEFNRLNRHQISLGDPDLGELRIGGTYRPDNVEGFIRGLEPALGIRGEAAGDNRTVLRR